jgi:hypothetical protein
MDKIEIKFPKTKDKKIEFEDQEIIVNTLLDLTTRKLLLAIYCSSLYNEEININDRYFYAEQCLMLSILDYCTDIKIFDVENQDKYLNNIIRTGLWDKIKKEIINYNEVREEIDNAVKRIDIENTLNKSVGNILESFADKLNVILDKISGINFSDIDVEKLNKVLEELRKERINIDKTLNSKAEEPKEVIKKTKKNKVKKE